MSMDLTPLGAFIANEPGIDMVDHSYQGAGIGDVKSKHLEFSGHRLQGRNRQLGSHLDGPQRIYINFL